MPTSDELRQELQEIPHQVQSLYARMDPPDWRRRAYELEQRRLAIPMELSVAMARENLEALESVLVKAREVLAERERNYQAALPAYEQATAAYQEAECQMGAAERALGRDDLLYARGTVTTIERQVNQARERLENVQQQQKMEAYR